MINILSSTRGDEYNVFHPNESTTTWFDYYVNQVEYIISHMLSYSLVPLFLYVIFCVYVTSVLLKIIIWIQNTQSGQTSWIIIHSTTLFLLNKYDQSCDVRQPICFILCWWHEVLLWTNTCTGCMYYYVLINTPSL